MSTISSWANLDPCKPLTQIIQEQEDERIAKQIEMEIAKEEDAYWEQIELATKMSIHADDKPEVHESTNDSVPKDESEEEEEEVYDDYFVERQTQNYNPNITVKVSSKVHNKPKNSIHATLDYSENNSSAPGPENLEIPIPNYEVSTSCGRVYKNRIPRPITTGASKTRENGPLEIERNTGVPGLCLIYNFLSEDEEKKLLTAIENLPWATNRAQTRRVQLYVPWKEEPKFVIVPKPQITPLPVEAKAIGEKIIQLGKNNFTNWDWDRYKISEDKFCELQINEYNMSDALGFHKDNPIAYTEVICGVSLMADCWIHYQYLMQEVKVLIPKRSVYLLTGAARYKWKHGIPPDSLVGGDKRISLTFRKVLYTKEK